MNIETEEFTVKSFSFELKKHDSSLFRLNVMSSELAKI